VECIEAHLPVYISSISRQAPFASLGDYSTRDDDVKGFTVRPALILERLARSLTCFDIHGPVSQLSTIYTLNMRVSLDGHVFDGHTSLLHRSEISKVVLFTHQNSTLAEWLPPDLLHGTPIWRRAPRSFVIKIYYNDNEIDSDSGSDEDDESVDFAHPGLPFETELLAMRQLSKLQGNVVPEIYGPVSIVGCRHRAIAMQYLAGSPLWRSKIPQIWLDGAYVPSIEEQCSGIRHCYNEMSKYGVLHGDSKLDNVLLAKTQPAAVQAQVAMHRALSSLILVAGATCLHSFHEELGGLTSLTVLIVSSSTLLSRSTC
jgi:hypothetical protein